MGAVFKKELKSYFYSPIAYILIGLFVIITSIYFFVMMMVQLGDFTAMLDTIAYLLIFLIPVLTMRLLTEDRKTGTETLLLTSPTSLTAIVLGKFLAALFVFLVLTAVSFLYPIILVLFGGAITAKLMVCYVGFILLGASFIAFGIFASSLTENQIIAVVIGIVGLTVIWITELISPVLGGLVGKILGWFSLMSRYREFTNGILRITPIVYFLSFIGVFLFLTIKVIERRRWSQG